MWENPVTQFKVGDRVKVTPRKGDPFEGEVFSHVGPVVVLPDGEQTRTVYASIDQLELLERHG